MSSKGTEDSQKGPVELDRVLISAGKAGLYQIKQATFCTLACLSCVFPVLSIVFIGYVPDHRCANITDLDLIDFDIQTNDVISTEYKQCSVDIKTNISGVVSLHNLPCIHGYQYDAHKDISIVTEWDLVCDKGGLAEMTQTILMVGQGFGATVFTSMADRFGRRPVHLLSYLIMVAASTGLAFVPNIGSFIALRFLMGACQQGLGLTAYSIFVEMLTPDIRTYACLVDGISWSLSVMALAPLGYLLRDYSWRTFQLASLISLAHSVFLYWFLDESIRWLVANNKINMAEKIFKKICSLNRTQFKETKRVFHEQIRLRDGAEKEPLLKDQKDVKGPNVADEEANGIERSDDKGHLIERSDDKGHVIERSGDKGHVIGVNGGLTSSVSAGDTNHELNMEDRFDLLEDYETTDVSSADTKDEAFNKTTVPTEPAEDLLTDGELSQSVPREDKVTDDPLDPQETNNRVSDTKTMKVPLIPSDSHVTDTEHKVLETKAPLVDNQTSNGTVKEEPEVVRYSILDIFKHGMVLKTTLILCFIWIVNSLTYYGLFLTSATMSGNRFLNYFLNAMVELPAFLVVFFLLQRTGRTRIGTSLLTLSGLSQIISVTLYTTLGHTSGGTIASNIFSILGKFGVSGSFMVVFIHTAEIYPTNMRNIGIGIASTAARIGGMVAPYSSTLGQKVVWAPGVIFGSCCIIAAALTFLLPETTGRTLPTTIQEMINLKKKPDKHNMTKMNDV